MIYRLGLVAVLSAGAWVFSGAVEEGDRTASAREVEELRSLVQTLEKKIADLDNRIRQVETRPLSVPVPPGRPVPGLPGQRGFLVPWPRQEPPKVWGRGEFNGHPYYIVPLEAR